MNNSDSSPDYHQRLQQVPRPRRTPYDHSSTRRRHRSVDHRSSPVHLRNNEPYGSRHQSAASSTGAHSEYSITITIINESDRDSADRILRPDVADNLGNRSYYVTNDAFDELIERLFNGHQEASMEEKEEDAILLEYFKTRIHHVAAPKDGVNNPTKTEEICPICQAEFAHEETIGTLGCGHEYHTGCIKQWLMRKKDCPMCRSSVLPFTST